MSSRKGISLNIRNIKVNIREGDIFAADGLKLIPFNEYFDTTVDDITISRASLNGKLIENFITDLDDLLQIIFTENSSPLNSQINDNYKKRQYQLGTIKIYKDFLLLAFSHFNEHNEAYLSQKDYEDCLRLMWSEICRVYAKRPVFLPLLGSGITRFDGTPIKSNNDLLKCMLCTLRTSSDNIKQSITILLTPEAMSEINAYELKGVK
jgi:hypothetical protein